VFSGTQLIPNEDGSISFVSESVQPTASFDTQAIMSTCERKTDDAYFRTDAVVMGTGEFFWQEGDSPYGYRRKAIVANPLIRNLATSMNIAGRFMDEYNRIDTMHRVDLIGLHDLNVGDTIQCTDLDSSGSYTGTGLVTNLSESASVRGLTMNIATNQRCPKIWGWDYVSEVYVHKPLAIGSEQNVWVTPDITKDSQYTSGSGVTDRGEAEWYDCSDGLMGAFEFTAIGGTIHYGRLIRDYWSDEGRGAWALTSDGIHYSSSLLPPAGQDSGPWTYGGWVWVHSSPVTIDFGMGYGPLVYSIIYATTKADDSTGIYCIFYTSVLDDPYMYICKVSRTGVRTLIKAIPETSPHSIYHQHFKTVMNVAKEGSDDYAIVGCYYPFSVPYYHSRLNFMSDGEYAMPLADDNYRLAYPSYTHQNSNNDIISFYTYWNPYYSPSRSAGYIGYDTSMTNMGTLPSGWFMASGGNCYKGRIASYDAKIESLYVLGEKAENQASALFRSDDHGLTWTQQGTCDYPSESFNPLVTGMILANTMQHGYIETYSIIATSGTYDGKNCIFVSSNDGKSLNTSGSFVFPVKAIMDMDE
jgi:hypothetical protein